MKVRYAEGWIAAILAPQPWAGQVARWSPGGGPKPVGLSIGQVRFQLVQGGTIVGDPAQIPRDWDDSPVSAPVVQGPGKVVR
ncbi:hypothetical protein ABZ738_31490 [Micromonospora sp. NPDC047793]|uniref:hypothetical protein n=1 Tax=Micromonospora sp. NPDC047793 TaxID=3154342 RepID=UPI0033EB9D8C